MAEDPQLSPAHLPEPEIAEYRALSVGAVAGLILGLLSPAAMVDPVLWVLPLAGVLVSGLALRRIARNAPALAGRKAALAGLWLSIFFGSAGPANWLLYRWLIDREARRFAAQWFDFLAHDEPHKAYQLKLHPAHRLPLDEHLWEFYRDNPKWMNELQAFVSQPLVRALLRLGPQARVRYYQTLGVRRIEHHRYYYLVFVVTYRDPEDGRTKSFFARLKLERVTLADGRANWHLLSAQDGFVPDSLNRPGPRRAASSAPARNGVA